MLDRLSPFGDSHVGKIVPLTEHRVAQPFALDPPGSGGTPPTPPAEVLDALDRAARVVEELNRKGVALSFDHNPQTNQVRVRVHNGSAPTQHELSLHGLLNLLDGDTSEVLRAKD